MSNADNPRPVKYDDRLDNNELAVLRRFENAIPSATISMSVCWTFRVDEKMRKLYQLRNVFRPSEGYLEMTLNELGAISTDDFVKTVVGGSRPCRDQTDGGHRSQ